MAPDEVLKHSTGETVAPNVTMLFCGTVSPPSHVQRCASVTVTV